MIRPQYLHSVNTWSPGSNDDNDDTVEIVVKDTVLGVVNIVEEIKTHGMMYGVGVDTINQSYLGQHSWKRTMHPKVKSFENFLKDCGNQNKNYRWSEPDYAALDFYMIPKEKDQINWNRYPTVNNNFAPKPFTYKCYST